MAENLKKGDSVDPMVPGRKLLGAYGFCIIDCYEDVLEVSALACSRASSLLAVSSTVHSCSPSRSFRIETLTHS